MNTDYKKSVLGDDAFLYQRGHDTVTKEELKNLTFQQKMQYFKDYYLKKVIVALIVIIALASIINETVFNRSDCLLSIACIDEYQIMNSDELTEELSNHIEIEDKNDYFNISSYSLDDYNSNMAFLTHSTAGSIDIYIGSSEFFEAKAELGLFSDLSEILPEELYEQLSDKLVEGRTAETDIDGNVTSYGEYIPYGIDLSDNEIYKEYGGIGENPILAISVNSSNIDHAIEILTYLFGLE